MKVLVLGARGMLGQEIVRAARAHGYETLAWGHAECDITAPDAAEKISTAAPDVIINCVAYNAVDAAEQPDEYEHAKAINGYALAHLAIFARDVGARLVHFSTDYVFDGMREEGYTEDAAANPVNAYGKTKLFGEQAVVSVATSYYIVRISKLFGRPAVSENAKRSFVDLMAELGRTQETINLIDDERSCPSYAPDVAAATMDLIADDAPSGIYHLANSGACTWYEFGKEIFALTDSHIVASPVPASAFPRAAARPHTSELLNTKRPPLRPWQEALKEYFSGV